MEKSDILYVESHRIDLLKVAKSISMNMLIAETIAVNIVKNYIKEYSAFVIDTRNGMLLSYIKRCNGYWEITNDLKKFYI